MPPADFASWGWRIPFLLSAVLVAVALVIRLRLRETPLFAKLKADGRSSRSPWKESFGDPRNMRLILLALFGATMGQAVVWYQGQFQALFFLNTNLGVRFQDAYLIVGTALVLGTPFFILFGRLSDRIGRKPVILAGCLIAAITLLPDLQPDDRRSRTRRARSRRAAPTPASSSMPRAPSRLRSPRSCR